jgi:hypothetical protein
VSEHRIPRVPGIPHDPEAEAYVGERFRQEMLASGILVTRVEWTATEAVFEVADPQGHG